MTYLEKLTKIIQIALEEDFALDDVTSDLTLEPNYEVDFAINARQDLVVCGVASVDICFKLLKNSAKFANSNLSYEIKATDGDFIAKNDAIIVGRGNARLIFAAERVILNTLQRLSGISSLTKQFVTKLNDEKITILDTRKTTIGLREIEKYATFCGGAKNHRNDLSDAILIKDNHIAAGQNIAQTVNKALKNNKKGLEIIVECDNLDQVKAICDLRPDRIMLDNMSVDQIKKAIEIVAGKTKIEVSGGVTLDNIESFRGLEIDYISIGALTHSALAVDIGLDIV